MSLSHHEAVEFLTGVLGIPLREVPCKGKKPTLSLLNDIIKQFQEIIPFQSVTACAVADEHRHLPSWSEIKQVLFAKHGGLCYNLNIFMKVLLDSIGYEVVFVSVDIAYFNDHVSIIASNLRGTGSKDLVEVGCGYPTFQAISLDFDHESPEYTSGFLRHKFVKRGDSFIWYHEPRYAYRPFDPPELSVEGWYKYADIKAFTPCGIEYFEDTMTAIYTVKESNTFLLSPRAVVFKNSKLVAIKGMQLIMETDGRKVEKREVATLDDLLHLYKKHFPQFPEQIVKDAIKYTGLLQLEKT